jgi:hypothetical protein
MLVMALSAVPLGLVTSVGPSRWPWRFAGMTTGLTDMLGNGRIAELEAQHDAALMNLNHAFFSFAYAGAAMLTGFAREAEVAPALWFIIGATILVLTLAGRDRSIGSRVPAGHGTTVRGPIGLHAWLAGGVVLVAFFVENSTEIWAALHIERTLGGGAAEGAFGPAMLGLTMGIGRLLGHLVTSRGTGGARAVLRGLAVRSGAVACGDRAGAPLVAYLGFGLVGLGASVVAPLALALAGQGADPARRTLAVSRAMLLGYMGFVVGPPLLGPRLGQFRSARGLRPGGVSVLAVPLVLLPRMRARGTLSLRSSGFRNPAAGAGCAAPDPPRPVRRKAPWSCRVPCG